MPSPNRNKQNQFDRYTAIEETNSPLLVKLLAELYKDVLPTGEGFIC